MPGSAAKVVITERQQKILQEIVNSRTSALRLVQRATIVLQGFAGVDNADIAQELGLGPDCVGLWRRRWAKVWPRLTLFECAETPADLRRALTAVLDDKPRSGNPGTNPRTGLRGSGVVGSADHALDQRRVGPRSAETRDRGVDLAIAGGPVFA